MTPFPLSSHVSTGPRKRIGVVVDAFNAAYQADLVRGLVQACERRHTELVIFPGGVLGAKELAAPNRNKLFDLVTGRALDGLVLLSSSLAPDGDLTVLRRFVEQMGKAPCFSIGAVLAGVPSIVADNGTGLRELVDHLVVDHGYRRLAFIGGPDSNEDAQARHRAFREQLQMHGIVHDSAHYFEGNFLPECGHKAVAAFFCERNLTLDAVVAANDYMAFGALEALAEHESVGLRSLPVTGFDNVERAKFSLPPLTTVEQRGRNMAEQAVSCLLEQEKGNPLPARQTSAGRMVVRRSCGCNRASQVQGTSAFSRRRSRPPSEGLDAYFYRFNESIQAELARASQGAFHGIPDWDVSLLAALVDNMRGVPGRSFIDAVELLLELLFKQRVEVLRLAGVLRVLRSHCVLALGESSAERGQSDDLLHQAGSLVSEMAVRVHARASLEAEQLNREINRLGTRISEATDLPSLKGLLRVALNKLGLRRFDIVSYPFANGSDRRSGQLLFSLRREASGADAIDLERLLPQEQWHSQGGNSQVVLPLFFRRKSLGYFVADFGLAEASYYEALRIHLSVALYELNFPVQQ